MKRLTEQIGEKKIYALLTKAVVTINGLLMVFIVIRTLPEYEFGLLALFLTFDLLVFTMSGGVVLQAAQKYAAESSGEILNIIVTNALLLYILLSLVPAFIIMQMADMFARLLHAPGLSILLKWLIAYVVTQWGIKFGYYILLARERVRDVFIMDLIAFFVKWGLLLTLFFAHRLNTSKTVIHVYIFANACGGTVALYFLRRHVKLLKRIEGKWMKKLLSFGKFTFGTNIGNLIHTRVDGLMIAAFYNPVVLAAYIAARRIADFFRHFVQAANMIVLPRVSSLFSKDDISGVRSIYYKGIIYSLIIVLPVVLVLVGIPNLILLLAYGGKYQHSIPVLRLFALCALISPIGSIGSSVSAGIGKPQYTFISIWLSVLINVLLNLWLIPIYGGVGAALATLAAMIAGGVTISLLMHRTIRFSSQKDIQVILREVFGIFKIR